MKWQQKTITKPTECQICEDNYGIGFNYGAFTCPSCNRFFQRYVQKKSDYQCKFGSNTCDVKYATRTKCPSCRYKKCLDRGMNVEGVGKGRGEYHGYSEVLVKSKCVNEPETNTAQNQETTEENQEKNEEKKIPTISTVEAMKSLNQLKDYFIFRGELSKSISHSFSELENLLLKIREEEKKQSKS